MSPAINLHNSTIVLVGMILIVSSTFVLSRMVPILSSTFVLQYACIVVRLYYSNFVLLVRLYYSNFVLLRMILITSSTPVLLRMILNISENDYHSQGVHQYYSPLYTNSRVLYTNSRVLIQQQPFPIQQQPVPESVTCIY